MRYGIWDGYPKTIKNKNVMQSNQSELMAERWDLGTLFGGFQSLGQEKELVAVIGE